MRGGKEMSSFVLKFTATAAEVPPKTMIREGGSRKVDQALPKRMAPAINTKPPISPIGVDLSMGGLRV